MPKLKLFYLINDKVDLIDFIFAETNINALIYFSKMGVKITDLRNYEIKEILPGNIKNLGFEFDMLKKGYANSIEKNSLPLDMITM